MCRLTSNKPMAKSSQGKCVIKDEFLERQWCLDSGVLAGCLSLALLTIGTSVSLPFYQGRRDELGCDALCYGTMTSTTSFLSLCGSTLIGWMSDSPRIGRHTCLYLGITSSMFGFIVSYFNPNSLIGMWISILPAALFQQNYSVLKALFSDYHENLMKASFGDESTLSLITQSRTDSVGKLGMAVGFAFMIGSFIGGTMLRNHTESMYCAMACVLLSGLFISLIPSPKLKHHCTSDVQPIIANSSICNNKSSFCLLKQRILTPFHVLPEPCMFILIIRIFMALAYNIFNTIWTVALRRRFNFGPKEHGKFMAFVGFSYAVAQGFLAKHVIAAFGPRKSNSHKYLLMMCCLILGLGRWYVYHTNNITCLYAIFTAIVSALGIMNTILTADTSAAVSSKDSGQVFGILEAAQNVCGMVGPILGGLLTKYLSPVDTPHYAALSSVVVLYGFACLTIYFGYDRFLHGARAGTLSQRRYFDYNYKKRNL